MSDTQGSHRRGGPLPEAYEAQPLAPSSAQSSVRAAGTGDPGPAAWDPEPALPAPEVPAPRGGRRRRPGMSPVELAEADTLVAAPVAPGSG
ncbi:hypothetical protein GT352_10235, partial [Streptomyces sp. SID1046]|nr:hypothetical protein [Streptomyces sp. SID1046]